MSTRTAGIAPGLHYDLDEATYHGDPDSLSSTGAKLILQAPAIYRYNIDHRPTKRVYEFGKAAHRRVLGTGEEVVIVQKVARDKTVTDADDYATKSAQEHRDAIRAEGKVPLLRWEEERIEAMAAALLADDEAAAFLTSDGPVETSAFWTDPETGVTRRCRFDKLDSDNGPLTIVDYKTTESLDEDSWQRKVIDYGYDIQDDWYRAGAVACGLHDKAEFVFVAQMNKPPYLPRVIRLSEDYRQIGAYRARRALRIFAECRAANTWPGLPPVMDLDPKPWHIDQHSEAFI